MNTTTVKQNVKEKYSQLAEEQSGCGCGCGCSSSSLVGDSYKQLDGHLDSADLGLGCGLPTEFAGIRAGDHVVDLGSGAGNDVFIARKLVGESGRVTGIDFTEKMIQKARENSQKLNLSNVEFILGDIENLPLDNDSSDVMISNCVLNLVPDKEKAFREMYRALRPGGHFCISDIVLKGELPAEIQNLAEQHVGCVAGALDQDAYIDLIADSGFRDVEIKKSREIPIPDDVVDRSISREMVDRYRNSGAGIFSLTIVGRK